MISGKLVHLIEQHWDEITSRIIDEVHREPRMVHIRNVVEPELREWGQRLLQNLGHWLRAGNDEELAHQYEHIGKLHFEAHIPLHESVRGLCMIREKMLDYVEEHIFTKDALELYAEEELERRVGRFFDLLTIHMVEGYERASQLHRSAVAAG